MIEISQELLNEIEEALKRATHPEFEKCGASICELLTKVLKKIEEIK